MASLNYGSDGILTVTDATDLQNITKGTIVAVVRPQVADFSAGIFILLRKANGPLLRGNATGLDFFYSRTGGSSHACRAAAVPSNFAAWTSTDYMVIAACWDISGVDADQKLYVGLIGHLPAEPSAYAIQQVGSGSTTSDAGNNLTIGNNDSLANPWPGDHQLITLIPNVLLTPQQIMSIVQRPARDAVVSLRPGYNGGATVYDESGNSHDGTVSGSDYAFNPGAPLWAPSYSRHRARRLALFTRSTGTTVSSDSGVSFEQLLGVSQSRPVPTEQNGQVLATQQVAVEMVALVAGGLTGVMEWLATVRASSTTSYEYMTRVIAELVVQLTWSGFAISAQSTMWESQASIFHTQQVLTESLARATQLSPIQWESLARAAQVQVTQWEALGLVAVAQSATVQWESLTMALRAVSIQMEQVAQVQKAQQVQLESLLAVVRSSDTHWESLLGVSGAQQIALEQLLNLYVSAEVIWESLQGGFAPSPTYARPGFTITKALRLRLLIIRRTRAMLALVPRTRTIEVDMTVVTLPYFSGPKRTAEVDTLCFDFTNELASGETLTDGGSWDAEVSSLSTVADATPGNLISGSASSVSGAKIYQNVTGGVDGCIYVIIATVTTSLGRTLEARGLLQVSDSLA